MQFKCDEGIMFVKYAFLESRRLVKAGRALSNSLVPEQGFLTTVRASGLPRYHGKRLYLSL